MPGTGDHVEKRGFNPKQVPKNARRSYDSKFKLAVIAEAKKTSNKAAARKFDVDPKQVRAWKNQEEKLKGAHATRKSFRGPKAGKFPQVEEGVVHYWRRARSQLCSVSRKMMVREAIMIARKMGIRNFKCSLGWIRRLMKRNGLSVRRRTTIAQRLPMAYEEKLLAFQRHVIALRKRNNYLLGPIGNGDQTPLYLDMPSRSTVEEVGKKSVQIKTTGNEKTRFTVMLTITADGRKLPPFIVFRRKTLPKDAFPPGLHVCAHESGSFNEDNTKDWLKTVWARRPGALLNKESMLVLDSFRGHLTDSVKFMMRELKTDLVVIPGGMTSLLQPLDVSVNKPFKNYIEELYNDWMLNGEKEYTPAGKIKRPSPAMVATWVKRAWDKLPERIIVKSFKKTSISNAMDGTEDDMLWQDSEDEDDDPDFNSDEGETSSSSDLSGSEEDNDCSDEDLSDDE